MNAPKILRSTAILVLACGVLCATSHAQRRVDGNPNSVPIPAQNPVLDPTAGQHAYGGYLIGIGDIINIRIAEEDDVSGRYQVTDAGDVHIPLLSKPVHAAGLTTFDFSNHLADELKQQQILKQPYVTVFIERGMTQNVSIVGPVQRPGIYPLEKPTRLMDIISLSGGLLPNSGSTIVITHLPTEPSKDNPDGPADTHPQSKTVDVVPLMAGNPHDNVLLKPGDQITVSSASVVYVVGAVVRPGAFAIQDAQNGMTVLRALALVEGTQPTASLGKTIIVRNSENNSNREEIPVDLGKIIKGKQKDPVLMANDILFIPQSGFKQGMRKMGDVAVAAAGTAAGYGLGLRISH